jgi:hypothetical protein
MGGVVDADGRRTAPTQGRGFFDRDIHLKALCSARFATALIADQENVSDFNSPYLMSPNLFSAQTSVFGDGR